MARAAEPLETETRISLNDLIAGLSKPEAFGVEGEIEVVQTHASVVFLTGEHAYKVKKPVRLWGLLDYGTFERRREMCEEEVRLNRRLAPEIYLGVVPITLRRGGDLRVEGKGKTVEHAVKMVRVADEASLLDRVVAGAGGIEDEIDRVAEALAEFHLAHRLAPEEARIANPSRFGRVLRENFRGTAHGVPDLFPACVHEALRGRMARRIAAARGAIRRRIAEGRMVDGHGAVRLEHVVRFRGRIAILDCIEFNERLRHIDPLSDLAFLSMDLEAHGRPDLAARLERTYLEHAPDADAETLLPLYRAYRAHVRAKVDEVTARDPAVPEEVRAERRLGARRHLALAWSMARSGEPGPLLVLHGPSGVGKSTLGTAIAPFLRAEVIRSDVVRRGLAGIAPGARTPVERRDEVYGAALSGRVYQTMLDRAGAALRSGRAAILDATFLLRSSRIEAQAKARALGAPFAIVDVQSPEDVVRARIERRAAEAIDESEADWEVHLRHVAMKEPFGEEAADVVPFAGDDDPAALLMRLLDRFESRSS